MDLTTVQLYPPRVLAIIAALEQVERSNPNKGRGAITYDGLKLLIKGTAREALRLSVMEARKRELVEHVQRGNGRGSKAVFALTAKGRAAVELPPLK